MHGCRFNSATGGILPGHKKSRNPAAGFGFAKDTISAGRP